MKRLNNKGYMLIEIILASVIAFLVIYFIIDLTVKMKNKNDDMYVKTLVTTDQTIVTKKLMDYALVEQEEFDCGSLKIDGRSILYKDEVITVISDYADVGSLKCSNEFNKISIAIPLDVKQQVDEDFDIVVDYRYDNFDIEPPTCSLKFVSNNIVFSSKEDNVGVYTYGISTSSEEDYNKKDSLSVSENTFYGYVMDLSGNKGECNIKIGRVYDKCLTGSNTCQAGLVTDYSNCMACKACYYTVSTPASYNLPTCKRINDCDWQGGGCYCSTTKYESNCYKCGCVYGKKLSDCATGSNTCRGGYKYVVK